LATLFIQTAFVGDLFLSIPSLKFLKQKYPDRELILYCRKGLGPLFKNLKLVDHYYEVDKAHPKKQNQKAELSEKKFELIVSVHESIRSTILTYNLESKTKLGYESWWNFFAFNIRKPRRMEWPEVLRQLDLLSALDTDLESHLRELFEKKQFLNSNAQRDILNNLSIPDWASLSVRGEVKKLEYQNSVPELPEKYYVVAPGSVWPTKRWTEDGFVNLMNHLNYPVVLVGSNEEQELCSRLTLKSKNAINTSGKTTIQDTLKIMSQALLVISNDSGAQHMACAVETPVVSLFGPTTLDLGYRPWFSKVRIAEVSNLKCRPCGKHGSKKCPIGTHECMKNISWQSVLALANQLVNLRK
jgi:heptosyltransferase-2